MRTQTLAKLDEELQHIAQAPASSSSSEEAVSMAFIMEGVSLEPTLFVFIGPTLFVCMRVRAYGRSVFRAECLDQSVSWSWRAHVPLFWGSHASNGPLSLEILFLTLGMACTSRGHCAQTMFDILVSITAKLVKERQDRLQDAMDAMKRKQEVLAESWAEDRKNALTPLRDEPSPHKACPKAMFQGVKRQFFTHVKSGSMATTAVKSGAPATTSKSGAPKPHPPSTKPRVEPMGSVAMDGATASLRYGVCLVEAMCLDGHTSLGCI